MKGVASSDGSKWDAFFRMDKSVSLSDYEDENSLDLQSSASQRFSDSEVSDDDYEESESESESESDEESEREYDSDAENKVIKKGRFGLRKRREKSYYNRRDDEDDEDESISDERNRNNRAKPTKSRGKPTKNRGKPTKTRDKSKSVNDEVDDDNKSTSSVFKNYVTMINSAKGDTKELTLIPIGGATQAQYMVLTPRSDFDNNKPPHVLSPQSIRSISLKKGLSNTSTTKKQIFKVKPKKAHEKKQFLKVHPKKLEEKYEKLKSETKARLEGGSATGHKSTNGHAFGYDEGMRDLNVPPPLFSTISNLVTGSTSERGHDDTSEEEYENDSLFNNEIEDSVRKKKHPLEYLISRSSVRSKSGSDRGIFVESESIQSQEKAKPDASFPFGKNRSRSSSSSNNTGFSKQVDEKKFSQKQDELDGVDIAANPPGKRSKSKRNFSMKKFFKFGKTKDKGESSIDLKQSNSSISQTQLGPNRVLSMVRPPVKSSEFALLKDNDAIQNEMVVFYYFGGEAKKSMDHIKKKEELIPGPNSEEVLIQVEASTVSQTDCDIRNERLWAKSGKAILPVTPGVDFVGKVVKCGEMATLNYGINVDDRVASLIQTGGNCKYLMEHANQLVQVPKKVKAHQAVIMVEVYLSALQILLLGITGEDRYKNRPLEGKEILILGGINTISQAMIELAVFLGANNVYTTAIPKHYTFLQELGATTLDIRTECWLPVVQGKMDLAVDSLCDDNYDSSWKALNPDGQLICNGMQTILNEEPGCITSLEQIWARTKTMYMPRTHYYDVYTHWEQNLEESKEDLGFLFKLLEKKALNPSVADTLPLRKVSKAHTFLDASRRIQGSFVCLPHSEG